MYIIKWLMGHPILATWALGAIAILLAMGGSGNTKKHEIDNRHITTEHAMTESHDADKDVLKDSAVSSTAKVESVNESKEEKSVEVNSVTQAANTVVEEKPAEVVSQENVEPSKAQIPGDSEVSIPSKSTSEAISDLGQSDTLSMLQMAREAYWNNGLDEAVQIYQKLIEVEPNVIEHKGELGNVYWRQGYPKKAAELYSEIAVPLVESGSSERVMNMIGFIQLFYPDRVEVILDRIERLKSQN